jgi:tRNA dimethylallyltransferase
LLVCCTNEREQLYELINQRVDAMFKSGWVTEVKELLAKDKNIIKLNALKAIGYDEIIDALVNNHNIDIEKIKQRSRHYAKKQLTWINHHYVDPLYFDQHNEDKVIATIKTWLK